MAAAGRPPSGSQIKCQGVSFDGIPPQSDAVLIPYTVHFSFFPHTDGISPNDARLDAGRRITCGEAAPPAGRSRFD
ncbi:unnamed protein product [Caenorhabditis auriculariae]|uniref:Uncharacterized protein n=1 Tax=Caenorhabditis auriculariae TaxID=2777116 RepID=A0A8S1H0F1_9PELO|nr:unnamed protein product [Caenorhabditis auriculariae]